MGELNDVLIRETWQLIVSERGASTRQKTYQHGPFITNCCSRLHEKFGVTGLEVVGRQRPKGTIHAAPSPVIVSEGFIESVNQALPEQPWKRGLHLEIMKQLNCSKREVTAAITELINRGARMQQKDGIVYDRSGKVVAFDKDRITGEPPIQ
jgi:hypothetical protein